MYDDMIHDLLLRPGPGAASKRTWLTTLSRGPPAQRSAQLKYTYNLYLEIQHQCVISSTVASKDSVGVSAAPTLAP